jgi:hypothetical protein
MPVYKAPLQEQWMNDVQHIIKTLRSETIPMQSHNDPGAIQDCWNSVEEIVAVMKQEVLNGWAYKEHISESLNSGDGTYRP